MEWITELICEVVLEGILAEVIQSKKIKCWVKTLIVEILCTAVASVGVFIVIFDFRGDFTNPRTWIFLAISLGLEILFNIGIVSSHKRNWRN